MRPSQRIRQIFESNAESRPMNEWGGIEAVCAYLDEQVPLVVIVAPEGATQQQRQQLAETAASLRGHEVLVLPHGCVALTVGRDAVGLEASEALRGLAIEPEPNKEAGAPKATVGDLVQAHHTGERAPWPSSYEPTEETEEQ